MIDLQFLESKNACEDGIEYFEENYPDEIAAKELILDLISKNKHRWANWLITRLLTKENRIKYAIFAAEQVLHIFEDKYPGDSRPRKAIEAAKEYLINPNAVAIYAADAADAYATAATAANANVAYIPATYAVYAAICAADAAAYAACADAAAYAAYAADAADAAAYAAYAADAAAYAAYAADGRNKIYVTILNYGLSLI